MSKEKIVNVITLSKRSGKLTVGFDACKELIVKKVIDCVIIANDLSEKTNKEVKFLCDKNEINIIRVPVLLDEFWFYLGKRTGIMCITDKGLLNKLMEVIANDKKD